MGTPQPKFPLTGHCSVVHDNTLYVYSPNGFQSLKLEQGAQWQALPMDVSLTGAQCVRGVPNGDTSAAKFYVVGGTVNATAADWDYPGLMAYSFANKKWDWIRAASWNTQNRVNHAAVYLADSQKILVYAGSQAAGNVGPSTQGFLYSTIPPYAVQSLESAGAPPSVAPMLMPAGDNKTALLLGGGQTNAAIWKFTEASGWQNLGVSLSTPITDQSTVQCTAVQGQDGSVALAKFNLGVSPNIVDTIPLLNKDGTPASPLAARIKRATDSGFPAYNNTNAPTALRTGYSLAQGDNGITVASGGDSANANTIVVFNAKQNSWVNATQMLGAQQPLQASASPSSTAQPTSIVSTPTASSTSDANALAAGMPNNKGKMLTVLGATLGTILGMALFLILILICLRYRKNKGRKNSDYLEKDRMSFADRGAEFMKEAGGAVVTYHPNFSNDSSTSLAIIQGRGANGHKRNTASDASTAGLVKKPSPLGYSDPVELSKFDMKPEQTNEKIVRQNSGRAPPLKTTLGARSSGWSRYFANNEATNLATVQADRSTYASDRTSGLSQHRASRGYGAPQIAPLDIPKFDGQRLSRVASGSPTLGTPNGILPHQVQPMQAELGRANSNGSMRSDISHDDHHFRKPVESWTPVGEDHRTSSNYTGSMVIDANSKYDVASSYYPDGTDSFYSKSKLGSFYPGQNSLPGPSDTRDSTATMFPPSNASTAPAADRSKTTFSSMYPSPPRLGEPQDRESTVTLFPGGPQGAQQNKAVSSPKLGSFYPPPRVGHESTVTMFPGPGPTQEESKKGQSDMSWLNLGTSR